MAEPIEPMRLVDGGRPAGATTVRAPGLDVLRTVAAFGVLVTHVAFVTGVVNPLRWSSPLRDVLPRLDVGVSVFFVLSGLLICRPFIGAVVDGPHRPATGPYLWRRALRIFPLYWVIHGGLLLASVLNIALILGGLVEGSFARVMRFRPLIELGKISYPVYLIHWPISLVLQPDRVGLTGWPLNILRFVVSVAAGYALGEWVERPIRSRRALQGRQGAVVWISVAAASVVLALWRGSL
jgi:peptidoglycan/LPS O-acetylase OafA/YrhL